MVQYNIDITKGVTTNVRVAPLKEMTVNLVRFSENTTYNIGKCFNI